MVDPVATAEGLAAAELVEFMSAAEMPPRGSLGIAVGSAVELAVDLVDHAPKASSHLLLSPGAQLPAEATGFLRHEVPNPVAIPLETHAFHRLIILPGALGGPIGVLPRLGELRRLVRPDGAVLLATGPTAHAAGAEPRDDRFDLDDLQRALTSVGLVAVKVRLATPVVDLTPVDHRYALSRLAISGALLLAVPTG